MIECLLNNELGGMYRKEVWSELKYSPGMFRKTTKFSAVIVGIPTKIRIEYLLTTGQKLLEIVCSVERRHEGPQLYGLYGSECEG
jgi:hypothetical protein